MVRNLKLRWVSFSFGGHLCNPGPKFPNAKVMIEHGPRKQTFARTSECRLPDRAKSLRSSQPPGIYLVRRETLPLSGAAFHYISTTIEHFQKGIEHSQKENSQVRGL